MDTILEKIHKSALKFLAPLSLEETYKTIVDEALRLVNGEYGTIMLLEGKSLVRVYSTAPQLYDVGTGRDGPFGDKDSRYQVVEKKTPIVLTIDDFKFLKEKFPALKVFKDRAAIMIPLTNHNKTVGILSVISLVNSDFSKKEMEILKLYGSLASIGIRKTQLYDETKQALETRDLFISMASHELKTPLTTINGYIQLLKGKYKNSKSSEAKWVSELSWESYRLTQLIKELLEVDRIKSGNLDYHWKEISLRDVVNRSLTNFRFSYPDREVVFEDFLSSSSDIIIGDFDKILQAVDNVLDNAAKYSATSQTIEVSLKSIKGCLSLTFNDHGAGIKKSDMDKIFERYQRGVNHRREGMGLGLYLVKNIIEKHRGEVKVKSRINKGTLVEIKLPVVAYK